jgi:PAS domain S-box-containing protein
MNKPYLINPLVVSLTLLPLVVILLVGANVSPPVLSAVIILLGLIPLAISQEQRLNALRVKTLIENCQRFANGLPRRSLQSPTADIAELDVALCKLFAIMQEGEKKQQALLANSAEVICTLTSGLVFNTVSSASRSLWGYDSFFLCGRTVSELILPSDLESFTVAARNAQSIEDSTVKCDVRTLGKDSHVWTSWSINWSSKEQCYFCVVRDVTAEKNIEQLKKDFVNMLSHDLRTPLLALQAHLELSSTGGYGTLPEKLIQSSQQMQISINQLIGLVNDLLEVEKMESGKWQLEECELPVSEIIVDAVNSVKKLAERKNLTITTTDIPSNCIVWADPQRLLQVVQNMLSNAIKFAPTGTTIRVTVHQDLSSVKVLVADQGPGIPADKVNCVFDRFTQLPGTEGTGLGLTICKAIVHAHGGEIGIQPNVPHGNEIWFSLPLWQPIPLESKASING